MKIKKIIPLVALLLISAGIYIWFNEKNSFSDKFISGVYTNGFEISGFFPDNIKEQWWVSNSPEFMQAFKQMVGPTTRSDRKKVSVEIKVKASHKGRYGHLGNYDREIQILEFRNMKIIE